MRRRLTILVTFLLLYTCLFSQDVKLIKDSLVDHYLSSGKGNSLFVSEGKYDKQMRKTGAWKAYSVDEDFMYISSPDKPQSIEGTFLKYGEGRYVKGNPHGSWKYYVIEDRTFRKILMREISYKHGVAEGKVTHYYINGSRSVEYTYRNGKADGLAFTYYDSGEVYNSAPYEDGVKVGTHNFYRTTGELKMEITFMEDSAHGFLRSYYVDGTLQESTPYVRGKVHGMYQYFHPNGKLWIEKEYRDNKLWNITGSYDALGNPRDKGTLVDGNGTAKYYNHDGVLYSIHTLKDGEVIGEESFDVPATFRE